MQNTESKEVKSTSNNKRIAKNTLMLYMRQILIMLVSLYTVRVVLKVLGVEDYGIYNVVGGIVTMFSFLSGTMASASQRYFAYDLGRKDYDSLNKTFSLTFLSYIGIAAFIFLICEIGGVWFVNNKMTIPPERLSAAIWTLQAALLSFVLTIMNLPYMAVLIAREKMDAYAYISILEAGLKLLIVFALQWIDFDKLKTYAILTVCSTALITLTYRVYCKRHFKESHFKYYWDWARLNDILSYAGWNMIGSIANILKSQGINILLNLFFNPVVNATRGIAFQVNSALNSFAQNFFTAIKPQITKYYSQGDLNNMRLLVISSSKYAFYLNVLLIVPLIILTENVLELWLVNVPSTTTLFVRLILINTLIDTYNNPIVGALQATGKIKEFQLSVSTIILLNLPITYILLCFGLPSFIPFVVSIALSMICMFPRLYFLNKEIGISVKSFLISVIIPTWFVFVLSLIIGFTINEYLLGTSLLYTAIFAITSTLITFSIIFLVGLNKEEKNSLLNFIKQKINTR